MAGRAGKQERFYAAERLDHPALPRFRACVKALHAGGRAHERLLARCGGVQAWQRLCWAMLALGPAPPNGPTPANVQATALTLPLKLLHRVGETLAAAQVEAILTGTKFWKPNLPDILRLFCDILA